MYCMFHYATEFEYNEAKMGIKFTSNNYFTYLDCFHLIIPVSSTSKRSVSERMVLDTHDFLTIKVIFMGLIIVLYFYK